MDWKKNIPEDIEVIIVDFLSANITREDEQKLSDWLSLDKSNQKLFDEIKKTWLATNVSNLVPDAELSWKSINNEIKKKENKGFTQHKKELETKFEVPLFIKIAASIIIFYFLGGLSWHYFNTYFGKDPGRITEIKSPLGSKSSVTLPDGTHVTLNAGSTISYAEDYGTKLRDVHLIGEAFFDVVTNKRKPFIVSTSSIKITALGTSFNVKAYEGEETVQTTLVEGKIKIENENDDKDFLYLEPNQVAVFKKSEASLSIDNQEQKTVQAKKATRESDKLINNKSIILKINDPNPYISWKDDKLIITGESLEELSKKLERMYDVTFKFEDDIVKTYSFKGTLEKETLQQVLNVIRLTAPINYEVNNKRVILSEDQELKEKYDRLLE